MRKNVLDKIYSSKHICDIEYFCSNISEIRKLLTTRICDLFCIAYLKKHESGIIDNEFPIMISNIRIAYRRAMALNEKLSRSIVKRMIDSYELKSSKVFDDSAKFAVNSLHMDSEKVDDVRNALANSIDTVIEMIECNDLNPFTYVRKQL